MRLMLLALARGGGGSFPARSTTFELAADGAHTWPNDPKHVYYNGKTYLTWATADTGALKIAAYDHATETLGSPFTLHTYGANIHNGAAVCVRASDHRLVVVYTSQDTSEIYVRISTNPEDVSAWGAETNIDSSLGGEGYTYPVLYQLTSEANQPLYLFFNDIVTSGANYHGYIGVSVSSDGGATWGTRGLLFQPEINENAYYRINSNGTDRIDVLVTDTSRTVGNPSALYHLYWQAAKWHKSDGTDLTGTGPWGAADCTLVKSASEGGRGANPGFVSYDGAGSPVFLAQMWGLATLKLRYYRLVAGSWIETVVDDDITAPGNYTAAMDRTLAGSVWAAKQYGSVNEVVRYDTSDGGATWSDPLRLTIGSAASNDLVESVQNGVSGLRIVACRGTYTSGSVFDYALWGMV